MTEPEWLACENPADLLAATPGVVSARKHRLWACAVARCDWDELVVYDEYGGIYPGIQLAVVAAEQFCDGILGPDELARAGPDAAWALQLEQSMSQSRESIEAFFFKEWGVLAVAADIVPESARAVAAIAERLKAYSASAHAQLAELLLPLVEGERKQLRLLAGLFRELVGSPLQPATLDPSWRSATVVALAEQMYASREFSAMPILADALQDAGCEEADILAHCRGPGPHVRGCWVVDLVLGKG